MRFDLSSELWTSSPDLRVETSATAFVLENTASEKRSVSLLFPMRLVLGDSGSFTVRIAGVVPTGSGLGVVPTVDGTPHYPMPLDSWNRFEGDGVVHLALRVEVGPRARVELREFFVETHHAREHLFDEHARPSPHLVVGTTYPSSNHLYLSGFVHSRVRGYASRGFRPLVVCALPEYGYQTVYEFEGVQVLRGSPFDLLRVLDRFEFEKIGVHFFDEHLALVFDRANGNKGTELLLWCHGPETLFWDLPRVNGSYFAPAIPPGPQTVARYETLARVMASFERRLNVTWVFVSEWMRERSRELLGLAFERSVVIPNTIDTQRFHPMEKSDDARRRVLMIRRYDDEKKYAVDVAVQAIVELKRRPIFERLQFTIVGDGPMHERLFAPLGGLPNVSFIRRFAAHDEIAALHRDHGIALFPTRYDAQGVSACEAAASGLVVVSSSSTAVPEFIPPDLRTLAPENDALGLADAIERVASDLPLQERLGARLAAHIGERCSAEVTIGRELALFSAPRSARRGASEPAEPTLTVVVPLFERSKYTRRCLASLLAAVDHSALEVVVVDGGSPLGLEAARDFTRRFPEVVRVLAREAGAQGSTIDRGLAAARGRYTRVVDADDWVEPSNFASLVERLSTETADLVLTDFADDWTDRPQLVERRFYENIAPQVVHHFESLCDRSYGFTGYGPAMMTSTFRTAALRKAALELTEGSPFVDLELCTLTLGAIDTARYLPLSVNRYHLVRRDHDGERERARLEREASAGVIFRLAQFIEQGRVSGTRREYLTRNILAVLIASHRMVLGEWLGLEAELAAFDARVRTVRALDGVELPPIQRGLVDRLRSTFRRLAFDGVKELLPFTFSEGLQPNLLGQPQKAMRYAFEYVAPRGVVNLGRRVTADRARWAQEAVGDALRIVGAQGVIRAMRGRGLLKW